MRKCLLAGFVFILFSSNFSVVAAPPLPASPGTNAKNVPLESVIGRPTLESVQKNDVLRVCVALNAPWVMHDKEGKLIGYSVDVAGKFAHDMGWKLQLVPGSWSGLLLNLRTNQCDIAISGLSITAQRALQVRFSQPYGQYDVGIVVNRARFPSGDVTGFEAAANGRNVAVRRGTVDSGIARNALPDAKIIEVENEQEAIDGLREGKFDAYVAEAPRPLLLAQLYPTALRELPGQAMGRTAHGMAVSLGASGLLDVANAWIISQQASGWLEVREKHWFQGTAWGVQL